MKYQLIITFGTEILQYPGKFTWAGTDSGPVFIGNPNKVSGVSESSFTGYAASSQFTHECNMLFHRLLPT